MFHEDFKNIEDLKDKYDITDKELEGVEILFAIYKTGDYCGDSLVLFRKEKKLFIVEASHCSCYGLEDQWCPIETNEKALKLEIDAKSKYQYEAFKPFIEFCREYFSWKE